jgi:osmoprotectant transport system ATP-binding protein
VSALVELQGVTKLYGDTIALHPTDLAFERGKTTVLIGPSGCGKSTVLRLIIRLLDPDSGTIRFDGSAVTASNVSALRRRIGYVIQDGGLFPHLTARKNILLMSNHLKRPAAEMEKGLAELCGLTRFPETALDRFPIELSGGQRQRISLMRALALSPELLLLDEPFGALDPLVRSALQKDLKEIFLRLKQTAILVTHDLAEAAYLADRIVLMSEGRIVQIGTLEDLRTKPASPFVTEFINAQRALAVI